VVTFVTGAPAMLALVLWSIWYAIRKLSDDEVPDARETADFNFENRQSNFVEIAK
jgi:hypothetical protein